MATPISHPGRDPDTSELAKVTNRRVIRAKDLAEDDIKMIEESMPTPEELKADRWNR